MTKKNYEELSFVPETAIRHSMFIDYDALAGIIVSIYEKERYNGVTDIYEFVDKLQEDHEEHELKVFVSQCHRDFTGYKIDQIYNVEENKYGQL